MTKLKLDKPEEVLFRQIHPNWIDDGVPASIGFVPSEKDQDKLSVDRSSITDAESSHALYTSQGYKSDAVYGVAVGEFEEQGINCFSDPIKGNDNTIENLAHAYADYSAHTPSQQKKRAQLIKRKALARGQLYP